MDDAPPENRFRFKSYHESLKDVHLSSALNQPRLNDELADTESHFYEALQHWRQLNLAPSFIRFAHQADPLSASLPLLLHNWKQVFELWVAAVDSSDDEGLKALFDLLQKMAHDLRTTMSPSYLDILTVLLRFLTRTISAAALTALLTTFSTIFKYLLIPTTDTDILEKTWSEIHAALAKCLPEVQRAMAEVWGSVLRRLKLPVREKAVHIMAANLPGVEDPTAWAFVCACKSVSQTLHTATVSLITPLVAYHLSCADPEETHTLIRRVFTALIHHVRTADQFAPIGDLLVKEFTAVAKEFTAVAHAGDSDERVRRLLEVISITCAVREGSRLSQPHLAQFMADSSLVPITPPLHSALIKFTSSVLTAGDMSLWMSFGRKALERSWTAPALFPVQLHGVLAELGWGGWKMIALPGLLRKTGEALEREPERMVGLLAALQREKQLGEVDLVWRQKVDRWACARLRGWEALEAAEINDILALQTYLSAEVSGVLIQIVEQRLAEGAKEKGDEEGSAASAWVLGASLRCLARRPVAEWSTAVDLLTWTRKCVADWNWSHIVLEQLCALSAVKTGAAGGISFDELYASLQHSIISHSRLLRLSSLRVLMSPLVDCPADVQEVLKRCLQGEEVPLDVQGVRERILRIGRVGPVVKDGDKIGADLCGRWLVAQLKVHLRPLWSPASGALAALAQRFGDEVWSLMFAQLKGGYAHREATSVDPGEEKTDPYDPLEEERSWRDPSAHKLRAVAWKWVNNELSRRYLRTAHQSERRFDSQSYELQLLSALTESASLAEKHNRDIVPFFLTLAGPDAEQKLPRQKLAAWLTLFSKFINPKVLHSTETLRSLYMSLLSHPDRALQTISLECVFTYKSRNLSAHENRLRAILDVTRWRDELTSLELEKVEPRDRPELVDVLIRLFFGFMLEKRGRSNGTDRRMAVLGVLGGCTAEELGLLVDLMLQPLDSGASARQEDTFEVHVVSEDISESQQMGFLVLLGDVLKSLGPKLVQYWPALIGSTIDFIAGAQARLTNDSVTAEVAENDEEAVDEADEGTASSSKATRSIRQLGVKRFTDFFRSPEPFDFAPYMPASFATFISPRVTSLDKENTQAPSALLELFYTWTAKAEHVAFLVQYDNRVLPKVYDCLVATNIKPAVISRIFDIVDRLLAFSSVDDDILQNILKPHVSLLLTDIATLVENTKGLATVATPLGQRQISILSEIAQYSTNSTEASTLLRLFTPLLRKPSKVVSGKIKGDMLKILGHLYPLIPDLSDRTTATYIRNYEVLAFLFQSLRPRQARLNLVSAFKDLASIDTPLQNLAGLLESLNAFSQKRLDEPDFDRRLEAFTSLNETLYKSFSPHDWLPLLHNMLHFIQDTTELAIRNSASYALRRFVDMVASTPSEFGATFTKVLLPGLKNGLKSKNEMVRTEVLNVLAYAVEHCDQIPSLQDLRVLLANGDEEASFFHNIHHVQVHRRTRTLRRLADQCDEHPMRSNTLAEIILPLIGNYIATPSSVDHHLVNEAITTTGRLAKHLAWSPYYSLIQRYLRLSRVKDESERVYVRALVALLENFHFSMDETAVLEKSDEDGDADDDPDGAREMADPEEVVPLPSTAPALKDIGRIVDAVNLRLLPNLLAFLESRDSTSEDTTRIPIAVGVVKVAQHLPKATGQPQITRLLTVTSQILRSRSQDTRDLVKDTLTRIAVILGPEYLPLIIKELRGALLRGPQLHVLAYVTHALLTHVTSGEHGDAFEILDDCIGDVAHVSAEVIFGESGKDVQAEEFKTKMREVRSASNKGLDSFSILAKHITPSGISSLLLPLRSIMQQTESLKVMQLVEEVLKRLASGFNSNKHLVPTELLSLCHTLITQNARFLVEVPTTRRKGGGKKNAAIVEMKRPMVAERDHFANNSFRFITFGLDLFNTALKRNRFDFRDTVIISRLETMVVAVGNTLYSTTAAVLILGVRCVASIVKCPLNSLDKSLPVFIRQILDIVRQAGNTEAEVVQVALRSLATILRDGPAVQVKETDLVFLLELISPDLEEPSRQGPVFTMLRAIVSRKFVVPEIYDLMEKVSEVMVTSQSPQVQELCRGVLLQFLLDYPQGKGRLRNQMTFLAKNLSYVHESGRRSVMELLGAVVAKFQVDLVREYCDLLFVSLVMVLANDDSPKCREMAAQLIKSLLLRLDEAQRAAILAHTRSWASQKSNPQLSRVSSQVYGLIIDAFQADSLAYIPDILGDIKTSLDRSASELETAQDDEDSMEVDWEWQTPYHSLIVLSKVLRVFPDLTCQPDKVSWPAVVALLLFPHAWVRVASCRLLGVLFSALPIAHSSDDTPDQVSLLTQTTLREIAGKLCRQLKSEHLDESLGLQVVKNLFFIGKCFYLAPSLSGGEPSHEEDFDPDDDVADDSQPEKAVDPLPWLFSKISYQVRSAHLARRNKAVSDANWSQQPLSALRWFAAMASHMEPDRLEKFLIHILTPVYRIVEDDTIRDPQMDELKTLAVELQDLVQSRVGTTKFSNVYNQIRQGVLTVQRQRRATRVLQVTTNPEAAAKRKMQKNSNKKDSRKRKSLANIDGRGRVKKRREE